MGNFVTLTIRSTHFFLIDCDQGRLLVDAGWELPEFSAQMKAYKIPYSEIRYVMFTHHHPDHAGLVQNIRNLSGARLIIHEKQIPYLEDLRAWYAKKGSYEPIRVETTDLISPDRDRLHSLSIPGEIVETPGHSDDSISLLLDDGAVFIGDLPLPGYGKDEASQQQTRKSWGTLIARGGRRFYHSHTPPVELAQVQALLAEDTP